MTIEELEKALTEAKAAAETSAAEHKKALDELTEKYNKQTEESEKLKKELEDVKKEYAEKFKLDPNGEKEKEVDKLLEVAVKYFKR